MTPAAMPVWDVGGMSDALQRLERPKGEEAVVGIGRQWLVTSWPEVSGLSQSITGWAVLWAARRPFPKIYVLEGHKRSQKIIRTKPEGELWFSFHTNCPSPGGKLRAVECLSLSMARWQLSSGALPVCLPSLSFYLKNLPFM